MRRSTLLAAVATFVLSAPALAPAQTPAGAPTGTPAGVPAGSPGAAAAGAGDPVVAKVGGEEIHASELAEAAQNLPEELRGMPQQMIYPMLLDQLVDRRAIVVLGRKEGLASDPAVVRQVARATDTAIQNVLLTRAIAPTLTDAAIQARYDQQYANKPGEEEVHAEHILVPDEATAKDIIAQLKAGKDFAELAKAASKDPSAASNSGDLGFFKKTDMLPEFADAAFGLQPGQITEEPVHTRFGWHVIKVLEKRTAPPPTLDAVRDDIRQELIQEGVAKVLTEAKQGLVVEKFNPDGSPMTDAPAAGTSIPPGGAAAGPADGTAPAPSDGTAPAK